MIGDTKVPIEWASRIIAETSHVEPPSSVASAHTTDTASLWYITRLHKCDGKSDLVIIRYGRCDIVCIDVVLPVVVCQFCCIYGEFLN